MRFEDVLKREQILYIEEEIDYNEMLRRAINRMKELYELVYSVDECFNEIIERDKLGNTAFKEGFAIPHARLDDINGVHFVIIKLKNPVRVPQPGGDKDIKVFAIYLVSKTSPNMYLKILSSTIKLFSMNDGKYLEQIKNTNNPEEIYKIFAEADIEIKHKIKVADIMYHYNVMISPEDDLKEVMDRLYRHQANTTFVVDTDQKLLGYISIVLILKSVIPDYIQFLDDLSFVKDFEPFERLLKEETQLKVKEVMAKVEETLSLDSSILEAAYYLSKHPKTNIPVIDAEGRLKGTVSPKAFLNKILRS
ncbi:MAG: PTS sugar transporter subunit IIA [Spirochaetota bacterium]